MFGDLLQVRRALLHDIPQRRFLVVGDLMLDRYLSGSCDRISPEAPVPVVKLTKRSTSIGGAANVANNLSSLGAMVEIAGIIGDDLAGEELLQACLDANIGVESVRKIPAYSTVVKTRVLAGEHQLLRIDEESTMSISDLDAELYCSAIEADLERLSPNAVILSDYAKGLCTPFFCQRLIELCSTVNIPVYVDPKGSDYRKYRGAAAVKPNQNEMNVLAQAEGWEPSNLTGNAQRLREMLDLKFVALTLGARGMIVSREGGHDSFPTAAKEVSDVSGAGDTVIASVVAGIHGGLVLRDAITLANLAAAQVASRVGCVPVDRADLLLSVLRQTKSTGSAKHFQPDELLQISDAWKKGGQTVALTNGFFDILQASHVRLLEDASAKSDRLIVALNSDESIRRLKGAARPRMSLQARVEIISALSCVDAVVVFNEDTPLEIIRALQPDLLVKGEDSERLEVVGSELVESYGGKVLLLPIHLEFASPELTSFPGAISQSE